MVGWFDCFCSGLNHPRHGDQFRLKDIRIVRVGIKEQGTGSYSGSSKFQMRGSQGRGFIPTRDNVICLKC